MSSDGKTWVDEAARLPIAFAQVREDPALDAWVIKQRPAGQRITMIASGGCTAAVLAQMLQVERMHLVDANPAQLALTRLKLALLQQSDTAERLALLGHSPMTTEQRTQRLREMLAELDLADDVLGSMPFLSFHGPDYGGRYERVFAAVQRRLNDIEPQLAALLGSQPSREIAKELAPDTLLGRVLDMTLDKEMSLANLVRLFGEEATMNPAEPFSRHFARRIRVALTAMPAHDNSYLWQMLLGRFPVSHPHPWFSLPRTDRLPSLHYSKGFMANVLEAEREQDYIHLSNILDWLSPEAAARTLDVAWRALKPGGFVLIRQLNSSLDIPSLGSRFDWRTEESSRLHAADRSFFYRHLHLGLKR